MRKVCVVLVDRANYGRLWPVMKAIEEHSQLELTNILSGSMVLERFGLTERIVLEDGFNIDSRVFMEVEGSNPTTMAKSLGFGIIEFASEFQRLKPDIILIIGDRYEALAATIAAAYQNIFIAHIQGGEVSGSIDESARHAITKFSHLHFPSTKRSAQYLINMGENPEYVHNFGCPCGDYIKTLSTDLENYSINKSGLGTDLDLEKPFLLVIFHPITTSFGDETNQTEELLNALEKIHMPTIWLWPNIDAGSDHISVVLKKFLNKGQNTWLRLLKNFEPMIFQKILKKTACAVGNSSSFIRDTTFNGIPVVLVGERQYGRETGKNLVKTDINAQKIYQSIKDQLKIGKYSPSDLYGSGNASGSIAEVLSITKIYYQKHLSYIKQDM